MRMSSNQTTLFLNIVFLIFLLNTQFSKADANEDLFSAIESNNINAVINAVNKGADVNAKNFEGTSVLHLAAFGGNLEIVKYLVGKGANRAALVQNTYYTW